jgi:hypothetical protein
MKLDGAAEILAADIAFWMEGVVDPRSPLEELGAAALAVSARLRALGVVSLLTTNDGNALHHQLVRSGRAWRHYLRRVDAEQAADDHHHCSGRTEPMLDGIAAGQFDLAREIASLSPERWREGHEYEEDHCVGRLLQILVMPEVDLASAAHVIERFQRYFTDDERPRLGTLQALLARDQAAFDVAFQASIDAFQRVNARKLEQGRLGELHEVAAARVFVEGLAMLRLAEKQGLVTAPEYDLCPRSARAPAATPLPEDADPEMAGWLR